MFECPGNNGSSEPSSSSAVTRGGSRLDRLLAQQLQLEEHKNLVAKKFHVKKVSLFYRVESFMMLIFKLFQDVNPYLTGEKLPVAAKKGINVDLDAD